METLFIIEPVAVAIMFILISIVSFLVVSLLTIILGAVEFNDDGDHDDYKEDTRYKVGKKIVVACLLLFVAITIVAPFTQPGDIYRKILIYRGINSVLVDKTINTADKAMDVLNQRLDKELKEIQLEK